MKTRIFRMLAFSLAWGALACGPEDESPGDEGGTGGAQDPASILPADLFPLASGSSWTYHVTHIAQGVSCPEGSRQVSMTGPAEFEGHQAYAMTDICGGLDVRVARDGDEIIQWIPNFWGTALPAPVEEGHTWVTDGTTTYSYRELGSVTVTAGTFDECWERASTDPLQPTNVYCRGVGLTRSSTMGRSAELTAYDVH